MNTDTYIEHIDKFKEELRESDLYQEYLKVDKALYDDKEVVALAIEKEALESKLEDAYNIKADEEVITNLLTQLSTVQRQMSVLPLVKKYMELRTRIKEILKVLEDGILLPTKGLL